MEIGCSASVYDGNSYFTNKASSSSSSSKKKETVGNGSHYLSSVLPDKLPQKKRNPQILNCFSGLPYRQKLTGGVQRTAHVGQNSLNTCTQRVMSAKLLRVKQLQNQLTDTQNQLNELVNENRLLRTLQKRQAVALQKFEGSQDQLPQLIKSHNEEIRILNAKVKQFREKYGDLENRLKRKDAELNYLKEHHKHLLQLSQDKQLVDREKLAKKVDALEAKEKEQTEKLQLLSRKLELEGKNYRHQLGIESNKLRETQNDLKSALGTINNLKAALEAKDKYVNSAMPKKYQKSMEHLLQNTHVSLPIPPRVSIRQQDKFSDPAVHNDEISSSDSDISYSKIFDNQFEREKVENRSLAKIDMKSDKPFDSMIKAWSQNNDQEAKSGSGDNKEGGRNKGNNLSDDSLDGLRINRNNENKKKILFSNPGADVEVKSNYSFGLSKIDPKFKDRNPFKLKEIGRVKPRSRSLSKEDKPMPRSGILKKGSTGKHYLADRESSSDEPQQTNLKFTKDSNLNDNFSMDSSLANFHQEMEYELEQVIKNESIGASPDADTEDIFENCEPAMEQDFIINPTMKQISIPKKPDDNIPIKFNTLDKFSKLSWNQIKNELPTSKEEVINILDQVHPEIKEDYDGLDEEKKASLLKMLDDIDNNFPYNTIDNKDDYDMRINGESDNCKMSKKSKKKNILEEIFR